MSSLLCRFHSCIYFVVLKNCIKINDLKNSSDAVISSHHLHSLFDFSLLRKHKCKDGNHILKRYVVSKYLMESLNGLYSYLHFK